MSEKNYNNLFINFKFHVFNTLTANYEHSRSNREKLPLPIPINLSKKP